MGNALLEQACGSRATSVFVYCTSHFMVQMYNIKVDVDAQKGVI